MTKKRYTGRLIVIEGADGAGTTTQTLALAKTLEQRFIKEGGHRHALCTKEPYSNALGAHIREVLKAMDSDKTYAQSFYEELALSFAANRLQHYNNFIKPNLEAGNIVISDRFTLSSFVYQGIHCDREWLAQINSRAPRPDALIYLRCSEQVCHDRIKSRGLPLDFYEAQDTRQEVIKRYDQEYALYAQKGAVLSVDGDTYPLAVMQAYLPFIEPLIAS